MSVHRPRTGPAQRLLDLPSACLAPARLAQWHEQAGTLVARPAPLCPPAHTESLELEVVVGAAAMHGRGNA